MGLPNAIFIARDEPEAQARIRWVVYLSYSWLEFTFRLQSTTGFHLFYTFLQMLYNPQHRPRWLSWMRRSTGNWPHSTWPHWVDWAVKTSTQTNSPQRLFTTHLFLASHKRNIGKQCRPWWDARRTRRLIRVYTVCIKYRNFYKTWY